MECEGEELARDPRRLDALVRDVLRAVGRRTVTDAFDGLVTRLVAAVREPGMTVQKSPKIVLATLFGRIGVRSPYLRDRRRKGACARPVNVDVVLAELRAQGPRQDPRP